MAWKEFLRRYDRLIWRCITKVTGRFTQLVTAEDAREIHANFLVLLTTNDMHKLRLFDPAKGNRLGTWIGLLAINCAWDYLRSLSRQPGSDAVPPSQKNAPVPGPIPSSKPAGAKAARACLPC